MRAESLVTVVVFGLIALAIVLLLAFMIYTFVVFWPLYKGSIFILPLVAGILFVAAIAISAIWWLYREIRKFT